MPLIYEDHMTAKRVVTFCIIESPYAPFTKNDPWLAAVELARNEAYINACLGDSFARGEVPFASHAIYTRDTHGVKVLDDTVPAERKKGMQAGFDIATALSIYSEESLKYNNDLPFVAKFVRAFYHDRGWTSGMADGMLEAGKLKQVIDRRSINSEFWAREADAYYSFTGSGQLYKWKDAEKPPVLVTDFPALIPDAVSKKET